MTDGEAGVSEERRARQAAKSRRYRARNREKVRARARELRQQNLEERRAYEREWRKARWHSGSGLREKQNAYYVTRRKEDPAFREAEVEYRRRYRAKEATKRLRREDTRRRVARRNGAETFLIIERDWRRLRQRQRGECFYCHRPGLALTIDHVIPLARGGRHSIGNIVLACQSCNSSKRKRLFTEWRAWLKAKVRVQ